MQPTGAARGRSARRKRSSKSLSPTPDDLPPGYCAAEAFLVLAMALGAQERLIEWMRAQTNALVALDPQEDYIAGNHSRLRSLIGKVDIFLPSAEEVRRLTGGGDWTTASRDFAALGPRLIVIKLGAEGVMVYDASRDLFLRFPPIQRARWTRPARETPFAGASCPLSSPRGTISRAQPAMVPLRRHSRSPDMARPASSRRHPLMPRSDWPTGSGPAA